MLSLSIAVLFIDLVKTFDHALRQVVIGWPHYFDGEGVEYLVQLGLPRKHAEDFAEDITNNGCILDHFKAHPHVRALITSLHTKSCFRVGDNDKILVVSKGGR